MLQYVLFKGSAFGELYRVRFSVLVSSSFRCIVMVHVAFYIRVVFLAFFVFFVRVPADRTTVVNQSRTTFLVCANRRTLQFPQRSNLQSAHPLLFPSQVGAHRQPLLGPLLSLPKFRDSSCSPDSSSCSPESPINQNKVPAPPTTAVYPSRTKSLDEEQSVIQPTINVVSAAFAKPRFVQFNFELAPKREESQALQCSCSPWELFVGDHSLRRVFSVSDDSLRTCSWQSKEQWQLLESRNSSAFQSSVFLRKIVVWDVTTITSIQDVYHFKAQPLPVSHSCSIDCLDVATVMWWQDLKPLFVPSKNRCLVQVWTSNDLIDCNIPGRRGRLGRSYQVHCFIFQQFKIDCDSDMFVFIAVHRSSHCRSRYHQHMLQRQTQNREQ
jgi:hypothetical protein